MSRLAALGCLLACLLAFACGHVGFFNPGGDAPLSSTTDSNIAFVTSTMQVPTTFGSDLSGADAVCAARATAGGLTGQYVAFLSTTTATATSRLEGSRGWVRTDGYPVLDEPDDITSGAILAPIDHDETGAAVTDNVDSGQDGDGVTIVNNCNDWSDSTMTVRSGRSIATSGDWIDNGGSAACGSPGRIYCFGLGKSKPLVIAAPPATARHAFLSVELFTAGGGLAAADQICASEAPLAGLSGTYLALLPTAAASAISRFSLAGGNWVRLDGVALAASPLAFAANTLEAPLNLTSARNYVGGTAANVLTGGSVPTAASSPTADCEDWTGAGDNASYGQADDLGHAFSTNNSPVCGGQLPLYCLEQ